jgi:hypothetical protein
MKSASNILYAEEVLLLAIAQISFKELGEKEIE